MTETDIVSTIMNLVTSNEGVTNTLLSVDQVAAEVNTLRGRMITDMMKVSLFRRPYMGFTQTIKEATVVKTGAGSSLTHSITIPRIIMQFGHTPAIAYIGGSDLRSPYRILTGDSARNAEYDQFIGKAPFAVYDEGVISFKNTAPSVITIVGVFETPSALEMYDNCYDRDNTEYPMPNGLIDQLIGKTAESYLRTMYRITPQPNTQSDIPGAKPTK